MADALEKARQAISKLTAEERRQLFRENGCLCSVAVGLAAKNPGVAIGALIGGFLGGALSDSANRSSPPPSPSPIEIPGANFLLPPKKP